jgi:hypothetical protein
VARAKGSISLAERAALSARERSRDVWRMVNFHRPLRERRGILTLAQIRAMSRLLADHADAIYRRADRAERGEDRARTCTRDQGGAREPAVTRVARDGNSPRFP